MMNSNNILNTSVPLVSQGVQLNATSGVLVNSNESCSKVLGNSTSVMSLGQAVQSCIPITQDTALASGQNNNGHQPVQLFQSSLENCENVLSQSQSSGQTFILTSTGNVLSSGEVSQGQVFIQGDELLGVNLSTPTSNSSSYTIANSESQYINTLPVVLGGTQAIGSPISRLIIQSNQNSTPNLNSQILTSNNGHYIIQMGQSPPTVSQNNKFSINNKGHIVIKAGSSKVKELNPISPVKDGVFRVVIPEGTTKLPKLSHPLQAMGNSEDLMKKHVQINLSNRASLGQGTESYMDSSNLIMKNTNIQEANQAQSNKKLYECPYCSFKFIKPLYLRMHIRNCKQPDIKSEKTPLLMCSFCKMTFKTRPIIDSHISKCSQRNIKDNPAKRPQDDANEANSSRKRAKVSLVDPSSDAAILYKCQDCDRTFSKERQYTSHVKRCTNISVHDLSGTKGESTTVNTAEEEHDAIEDPFADPPMAPPPPTKRGRGGGGGRRGRPPGRPASNVQKVTMQNNVLFEGNPIISRSKGLFVADNDNLVRSTTGLAHTVQLSLESSAGGQSQTMALIADLKGVRRRDRPLQAWSLICSLCQKMFLTKAALAAHIIETHGQDLRTARNVLTGQNIEDKLYGCPLCHLHYQSSETFLEHLLVQHTTKLQEEYKSLQAQTASFVCALCSLVLLTKNMLMEHLSLEHLDHLEKVHLATLSLRQRKKQLLTPIGPTNGEFASTATRQNSEEISDQEKEKYYLDLKPNVDGNHECGLCGEEFNYPDVLLQHYSQSHSVQVDSDGLLIDSGLDVDIRVKNTKDLIKLADGRMENENLLPEKTVLIRKKPKQSWQCQRCQQIFTKQMNWLRHVRESCGNTSPASEGAKTVGARESHFFCNETDCGHLAFYQVKSLFKHLSEVHKITVRKERKTFPSLGVFHQWLNAEENSKNVKFLRDNAKVEKNNVKLIQMVCQRFHTAKMEQAKEKETSDLSKPSKKRWSSRIQHTNFCHARIHLRVELNPISKDYDGETQMIYYPHHFHVDKEEPSDVMSTLQGAYPQGRQMGSNESKGNIASTTFLSEGDSASSFSLDSPCDTFQLPKENNFDEPHIPKPEMLSPKREAGVSSPPLEMSSLLVPTHPTTHAVILPHSPSNTSSVIYGGDTTTAGILTSPGESRYIVMNAESERVPEDPPQDFSEEYVLPADEAEWTKLFNVLSERVSSGELTEEEKKEGESLLSYRNLIPVINISQQVSIFQRMCSITNTSLESI